MAWVDVGVVMLRPQGLPVPLWSPWPLSSSSWRRSSSKRTDEEPLVSPPRHRRLLLSFDLDDTLWYTDQVLRSANEAMIQAMAQHLNSVPNAPNHNSPIPVMLTVEDLLTTTRALRKQLKDPMTHQDLRKLAIRTTFQQQQQQLVTAVVATGTTGEEGRGELQGEIEVDEDLVNQCYQGWEQERHAAAERCLLPNAVEMLQEFKPRTSLHHNQEQEAKPNNEAPSSLSFFSSMDDICIVAITNGAGNPLCMPNTLQPYFDFCVSGEDPTVFPRRKPHSYIYQKTLQDYEKWWQARQETTAQQDEEDHLVQESAPSSVSSSSSNFLWCHVGDCLANDVSASADCGARAVWMTGSSEEDGEEEADTSLIPAWSTAPEAELEQRRQLIQEGKAKVTARIRNLIELPRVIEELLVTGR